MKNIKGGGECISLSLAPIPSISHCIVKHDQKYHCMFSSEALGQPRTRSVRPNISYHILCFFSRHILCGQFRSWCGTVFLPPEYATGCLGTIQQRITKSSYDSTKSLYRMASRCGNSSAKCSRLMNFCLLKMWIFV